MHALLRRHGISALLLLLLHVRLILERLLLIGGHVGCLRDAVALHVALRHGLWHGRCCGVGFVRGLDGVLVVDTVGVGGLGGIEAGLV